MPCIAPRRRTDGEAETGFTLIELLVVILVIGVLAAIAVPLFLNQRQEAALTSLKSDLKNAATSMETEAIGTLGTYPSTLPSSVRPSEGNTLRLRHDSGNTNLAAGSSVDGSTLRDGRAGYYSNNAERKAQWEKTANNGIRLTYDYPGEQTVYSGPYWDYLPEEPVNAGQTITARVEILNTRGWCLTPRLEQRMSDTSMTILYGEEQACGQANKWTPVVMTFTTTIDDIATLTPTYYIQSRSGDVIEYRNPIVVLGDEIGAGVSLANNEMFCIEGEASGAEGQYWHYSKLRGGLREGRC